MERIDQYVSWLLEHGGDHSGLRYAVDCSNGMAGVLAGRLFPDALLLNAEIDGRFPSHSPNPLKADAREQAAAAVREHKLDCAVIFDGDADRAMFIDERGSFIQPDYLIPVLAETFGERNVAVIHDVRTSRAAIERIREIECKPVMGKVGHAFAKVLLRETEAVCGGELAGHYYFRDFVHCDSGELAALRILSAFAAAKRNGKSVSEFMSPLLDRYANSGEVNFKVEDKSAAVARVLECAGRLAEETGRCEIDGYRLEYAEGWISVRQSNTEPYLRLIVECDTSERMKQWLEKLSAAINGVLA
jgi:phosphomannomutase